MMKTTGIIRDERTMTVENASYRRAYLLLSFGVLLSMAWRGFMWNEASWDLLGLVIVSGFLATYYQAIHQVLTKHWVRMTVVIGVISAIVAAALAAGMALVR
jgi:hypothetical protein